jgi:hypothetical protein
MKERTSVIGAARRPSLDPWITMEDLENFKTDLLSQIRAMLPIEKSDRERKWLKSYQVKELLGISSGTLQTLRIKGTLPYTKIGGALYYEYKDIQNILDSAKIDKSKGKKRV